MEISDIKPWQKYIFYGFSFMVILLGAREMYNSSPTTEEIDADVFLESIYGSYRFGATDEERMHRNDFVAIKNLMARYGGNKEEE